MPTAVTMLEAFANNFAGLTRLLTVLAYLIGMWAGFSAARLLMRRHRFEGSATLGAIGVRLVLCAVLLYLPTAISNSQETFFNAPTISSYSAGSAVGQHGKIALDAAIRFTQLFGLWAFIYGWMMLNRAHGSGGYDPRLGGKSVAHLIGGVFCMNIAAALQGIAQSFGAEKILNYLIVTQ